MASGVYNKGKYSIGKGTVDWENDTIKVMLLNTSHAFNPDHNFVGDIVANEISGVANYTGGFGGSGRKTLATATVTENDTDDAADYDAVDPAWTALGAGDTIRYAVYIKEITNDAASVLICCQDLGANYPTNGGDFSLTLNARGIMAN